MVTDCLGQLPYTLCLVIWKVRNENNILTQYIKKFINPKKHISVPITCPY